MDGVNYLMVMDDKGVSYRIILLVTKGVTKAWGPCAQQIVSSIPLAVKPMAFKIDIHRFISWHLALIG